METKGYLVLATETGSGLLWWDSFGGLSCRVSDGLPRLFQAEKDANDVMDGYANDPETSDMNFTVLPIVG